MADGDRTLALSATLTLAPTYTNENATGNDSDDVIVRLLQVLTTGTTSDKADRLYRKRRSATTTGETLDLTALASDPFGNTLAFTEVRGILIVNRSSTVAEYLLVGGAATNAWLGFLNDVTDLARVHASTVNADSTIKNHGYAFFTSPADGQMAVSASNKDLKVKSASGTVAYDIYIWGTSA